MPLRKPAYWCALALTTALLSTTVPTAAHAAPPPVNGNQLVDISAVPGVASIDNEVVSPPDVSADGRYVVFSSDSTDLLPGAPIYDQPQIYLRDTVANTTKLISAAGGVPGNHWSHSPQISDDGMVVAYLSNSTNLAPGKSNRADQLFVWSAYTGMTGLVSTSWLTGGEIDRRVASFDLADSGTAMVYESDATDVLGGDPYAVPKARLYKVSYGETTLVARDASQSAVAPSVSRDGRYVAFYSNDAHTAVDPGGFGQAYVMDTERGLAQMVSADAAGIHAADSDVSTPVISGDGRIVAFSTAADNIVPGTPLGHHVFARDLSSGRIAIESRDRAGSPMSASNPSLSSNGNAIAYESGKQVLVRSRISGATDLISIGTAGTAGNAWSEDPVLSADGRFVVWRTGANNLTTDRYPTGWDAPRYTMLRNLGTTYTG
jgi:Tol biopolymer transport system component